MGLYFILNFYFFEKEENQNLLRKKYLQNSLKDKEYELSKYTSLKYDEIEILDFKGIKKDIVNRLYLLYLLIRKFISLSVEHQHHLKRLHLN